MPQTEVKHFLNHLGIDGQSAFDFTKGIVEDMDEIMKLSFYIVSRSRNRKAKWARVWHFHG